MLLLYVVFCEVWIWRSYCDPEGDVAKEEVVRGGINGWLWMACQGMGVILGREVSEQCSGSLQTKLSKVVWTCELQWKNKLIWRPLQLSTHDPQCEILCLQHPYYLCTQAHHLSISSAYHIQGNKGLCSGHEHMSFYLSVSMHICLISGLFWATSRCGFQRMSVLFAIHVQGGEHTSRVEWGNSWNPMVTMSDALCSLERKEDAWNVRANKSMRSWGSPAPAWR